MGSKRTKNSEIVSLLDSDDELPSDYVETPYVPAYQNDDRFKTVDVNWKNIIKINEELQSMQSTTNDLEKSQFRHHKFLRKGILNKNDIFLLKCIESSDNSTLLWFVNFLLLKDLQSNYMFLTSCLVPNIQNEYTKSVTGRATDNKAKQRYKVVVM